MSIYLTGIGRQVTKDTRRAKAIFERYPTVESSDDVKVQALLIAPGDDVGQYPPAGSRPLHPRSGTAACGLGVGARRTRALPAFALLAAVQVAPLERVRNNHANLPDRG
jgi:hypothetical protein